MGCRIERSCCIFHHHSKPKQSITDVETYEITELVFTLLVDSSSLNLEGFSAGNRLGPPIIDKIATGRAPITVSKSLGIFFNHNLTELINKVNPTLIGAMLKHSHAGYRTDNASSSQKKWRRISLRDMRYMLLVCFSVSA